jgi:hypothetical protein
MLGIPSAVSGVFAIEPDRFLAMTVDEFLDILQL